jgi:predicted lipid-binding transport protein (Tim44 family)
MKSLRAGLLSTVSFAVVHGQAMAAPAAQQTDMGIVGWIAGAVLAAGAGLFVYRMNKSKDTPANASVPSAPPLKAGVTRDFDEEGFLKEAKASFARMQRAWDKADTNDLQKFTTPEAFAELSAQVGGHAPTGSVTEVVTLDAELLGIETVAERQIASVKFVGSIKPSAGAPAEPVEEIWNMARAKGASGAWMLAGVQQLS